MTNPAMLAWQWREILGELGELQAHGSDPTCPCTLADSGEYCLPKHALRLNVLARETGPMAGPVHTEMLEKLAEESLDYHNKLRDRINCGKAHKDEGDVVAWAREWRKKVEPIYYACQIAQKGGHKVTLHQEPVLPEVELAMSAPFGWPGGKKNLKPTILSLLPPHKTYVDLASESSVKIILPTLLGTPKQIVWAQEIRRDMLNGLKWSKNWFAEHLRDSAADLTYEIQNIERIKAFLRKIPDAKFFIQFKNYRPYKEDLAESLETKPQPQWSKSLTYFEGLGLSESYMKQDKFGHWMITTITMGSPTEGFAGQIRAWTAEGMRIIGQIPTTAPLFSFAKPLCTSEQKRKLERCILKVKARNQAEGCPAQGTGAKGCPVPQAVCQSSIGCRPGRKAELHAVEHAFTICQGPRGITIGSEAQGTPENVTITPECPPGNRPFALFHTHPHSIAELSEKDRAAMRLLQLPVCAGVPGTREVSCERP